MLYHLIRIFHIFPLLPFRCGVGIPGLYRIETLACTPHVKSIESKHIEMLEKSTLVTPARNSFMTWSCLNVLGTRKSLTKINLGCILDSAFFVFWIFIDITLTLAILIFSGFRFYRVQTCFTLPGFDSIEAKYAYPSAKGFDSIDFTLGVHARVSIR